MSGRARRRGRQERSRGPRIAAAAGRRRSGGLHAHAADLVAPLALPPGGLARLPPLDLPPVQLAQLLRVVEEAGDALLPPARVVALALGHQGPYLFFGVVALTTRRRGYECVRAWAQPIVSVHRPVPLDSDFERRAFGTLTTTLRILGREFKDAEFEMEKPVFEMDTKQGPCLPDFLIRARQKGEERTWVIEVMGFDRPDYLAGKEVTHERMEELGPVILMDGKRFEAELTSEGRKVTERIRADVEGEWPRLT